MASRKRAGFSLVEILVVMVIIGILAAFLLPRYLSKTVTPGGKTVDSPINRAKGVECTNNLQQIRQAYTMATNAGDENRPNSLQALKTYGVSDSMLVCPVGKVPYRFNAATGQVGCPYPSHERF